MDDSNSGNPEEGKLFVVFILFGGLTTISICYKVFEWWQRRGSVIRVEEELPPYSYYAVPKAS